MSEKTLVIMAAGIGSRFGETRIKQLEPIGPYGELLIDYSIYDAKKAGFSRVIFIIRRDIEQLFRASIGDRISTHIKVEYAFQEKENIPVRKELSAARVKPWGTGQAILSCRGMIDGAFAVINADDYYGRESFQMLGDFLGNSDGESCLVAFRLKNTLSKNGTVTRGVCKIKEGCLERVCETKLIERGGDGIIRGKYAGEECVLEDETPVSMNMFGFTRDFIDELDERFKAYLEGISDANDGEFLVPTVVDEMIKSDRMRMQTLYSDSQWFGMTYIGDVAEVRASVTESIADGRYPEYLWK